MKWRTAIGLALVGALYVFDVHLKTEKIFSNPTWDWQDETGQFWSEFAFHYRFAKFFAGNRDWSQLSRDRSVQYPDTINDWAEFTVAMELPAGLLYRWLNPGIPFHVFIVWFDCLVSSLTLFGLYFLGRALWRSDLAGVLAAALYAGLYPSYGRTVKNLFLREDFAMPLIVFALFFTVRMWQEDGWRHQVVAGLAWLAALASWHLTQFVLAVGMAAAVLVYLGKGETPRRPWFVLVMLVGSVLIPVLWAKQFYISPTMCALYALTLAVWINGGRKKATLVFAGSFLVLAGLGAFLQKSYGEYAHVYQLFFYKLRYLGVKPEDPALLPWEARCLWEGAFETASGKEFWRSLLWCGPLAVAGAWRGKRAGAEQRAFLVFALLLAPLSWMVVRFFTFLGWAAAAVAARTRWLAIPFVVLQLAMLDFKPLDRGPVKPESYRSVAQWIQEHTPTNAVLLASVSESPVLLAHTGRPIILHSKFENRRVRERYRQFLEAAYGGEESLHEYCRRYGADYFVWDAGFLSAGRRYKAGVAGEATALPATSRWFKLEMSTDRFAVFRVLKEDVAVGG
jgi:hypothetical protein